MELLFSVVGGGLVELGKCICGCIYPKVKNRVYLPLKWSYDSLQGIDNISRIGVDVKSCFLYCCLYPEDFLIEVKELVHSWLGEGIIDEVENYEASFNRGIALVEYLKDSCLLEDGGSEGYVQMHDAVRDVAIWIVSFLEDERGFLVCSGIGLIDFPSVHFSESLKRVSFMENRITNLPDCAIQCPHISTLLLQGNSSIENVPHGFLLGFQALKVLNLCGTAIQTLPLTLIECGELQALFLSGTSIKEIPSLGGLTKLKMIDVSATKIKELPEGMEKLTNLRKLDLSYTRRLNKIRAGILSQLCSLEDIDMTGSAYRWAVRVQVGVGEGEVSFEELGCLRQLSVLNIHLDLSCLSTYPPPWIKRLNKFQFFVGGDVPKCTIGKSDVTRATFFMHNFSRSWSLCLLNCASSILLESCEGFEQNPENFCFTNLKSLHIWRAHLFKQDNKRNYIAARSDLLPSLEELVLDGVSGLNSISQLADHFGLRLSKLRVIRVLYCYDMNYILSVGGLVLALESLEEVTVRGCNNVVVLFRCESSSQTLALIDTFVLNLKRVKLAYLRRLKTLSEPHVLWQQLEELEVIKCNLVKKLPFTDRLANTIKDIRGEPGWWDQLDDEDIKSTLQQYFTSVNT